MKLTIRNHVWSLLSKCANQMKNFLSRQINRGGQRIEWIKEIKIVTKLIPNGKMWMVSIYKAIQSATEKQETERTKNVNQRETRVEKKERAKAPTFLLLLCSCECASLLLLLLHVSSCSHSMVFLCVGGFFLHSKLLPFFM